MTKGRVKWFSVSKGYGFLEPDDDGDDVFVHISALEKAGLDTLREKQRVEFDVEKGANGKYKATNITVLE